MKLPETRIDSLCAAMARIALPTGPVFDGALRGSAGAESAPRSGATEAGDGQEETGPPPENREE